MNRDTAHAVHFKPLKRPCMLNFSGFLPLTLVGAVDVMATKLEFHEQRVSIALTVAAKQSEPQR